MLEGTSYNAMASLVWSLCARQSAGGGTTAILMAVPCEYPSLAVLSARLR